jgi:hypothetical protein
MADAEAAMSEADKQRKLAELDRLLNDPLARLDPHRVWALLAEISGGGAKAAAA